MVVARVRQGRLRGAHAEPGQGRRLKGPHSSTQITTTPCAAARPSSAPRYNLSTRAALAS